jgi:ADP-ribose pyrophosphatase YjhB (NUDIX family)
VAMHRPTDSVRIVLFDRTNPVRFLVITEADDPDNWKLPGGKFEKGADGIETPDDAAERELGEELGLRRAQVGLRVAATLLNDDGVSARYIYVGVVDPKDPKPSAEIARSEWFSEATLPECQNRNHMLSAVAIARPHHSAAEAS